MGTRLACELNRFFVKQVQGLVILIVAFACNPAPAQVLYEELFPHPGGGNMPVSVVGWANDVPAGTDNRLYESDEAVFSFFGSPNTEAFYTTTATDTGSTGDAFPTIDPTSFPGLNFNVDLQSQFNPGNVEAYWVVQVGGDWFSSVAPLATPGSSFATQTLSFDPTAALWNELTVSGNGTGTGATIGTTAAMDLSGMITGAGLVFDRSGSGTHNFDNFTISASILNEWGIDGGGSFNNAANWTNNTVPTDNALFGSNLMSGDAIVTLDNAVSLNSVIFRNGDNQYTLAGSSALTLTGDREIETSGTHHVTADILGANGLVKTGTGTLVLDAAKSYQGTTDVQTGTLFLRNLDAIQNQASATLNIDQNAVVELGAGATGTLAAQLNGGGILRLTSELGATDMVTLDRSNLNFNGVIRVNAPNGGQGGTLVVSNNNALGAGGFTVNRTAIDNDSRGKVALTGGVTIANEVLDIDGRTTDAVQLTSDGNNTWNGIIEAQGDAARRFTNIESTSGTLTLNRLYQEQDNPGVRSFVFSGAGNTTITGGLSDATIDIDNAVVTPSGEANVGVIKKDSGVLTIGYATADANDYWFGPTVIEAGTMVVNSAVGDVGELRSLDITVKSGATLDLSAFNSYSQQQNQMFRGTGTIQAGNTLGLFDDASVAPGDGPGQVGTLNVNGNVSLSSFAQPGEEGAWRFDLGNSMNSLGDTLNVNGNLSVNGSPALTVDVTPAYGQLDAGTYTVVTHNGGATTAMNAVTARVTDINGNALTTRQSISVSGSTAGQVNVTVSGEEAARTWNGNMSGAWDVAMSNNWQEGDQQYQDLDRVTFNDTATGTTDVTLASNRSPSMVTFGNSTRDYHLSGEGGIIGSGSVAVTGTGQVTLANTGNNYSGATTISSGGNLRMTSATTGSITNSGSTVPRCRGHIDRPGPRWFRHGRSGWFQGPCF